MSDQDIRNSFAIGGLIIGFYAGNPALGYLLGSAIGSHLAGPLEGPDGPRLDDLKAFRADYGAPLAKVYGAMRVPGHLIWSQPFTEHVHEETVGDSLLSSGTTVTTYSYTASFAVAVAQGPIVGVRRIWANGQLIYDRRSALAFGDLELLSVNIDFGAGNTQNYALTLDGTPYTGATLAALLGSIAAQRLDLRVDTLSGNRAQIQARTQGHSFSITAASAEDSLGNPVDARSIWPETTTDHDRDAAVVQSARLEGNLAVYLGTADQSPDPTIEAAEGAGNAPAYRDTAYIVFRNLELAPYGNALPRIEVEAVASGAADSEIVTLYSTDLFGSFRAGGLDGSLNGDPINTLTEYNAFSTSDSDPGWTASKEEALTQLRATLPPNAQTLHFAMFRLIGESLGNSLADPRAKDAHYLMRNAKALLDYFVAEITGYIDTTDPFDPRIDETWKLTAEGLARRIRPSGEPVIGTSYSLNGQPAEWIAASGSIAVRIRPITPPATCNAQDPCKPPQRIGTIPGTGNAWCIRCDGTIVRNLIWAPVTGTFRVLRDLVYDDSNKLRIQHRAQGPVLRNDDPLYDDADFWTAAATGANISGTYGVDYPVTVLSANRATYVDSWLDASPTSLSTVVADICTQAGLAPGEYDVSGLVGAVNGYALTRPTAARAALEPLALAHEFDAVERDGVLVFVPRGGAPAASLGAADIGAGPEGESQPGLALDRTEDDELPRSVSVLYADLTRDYQPQSQRSSRQQAGRQDVRLNLPMALTDAAAATLAERQLWRAWAERETLRTGVLRQHARLEPGDVVNLDDGHTQREARILRTRHLGGRLVLEAVSQDQTVFGINRPAQAGQGSRATLGLAGPTSLLWIDSTLLSDADDAPGAYVALSGSGTAWGGAALYRSLDLGKSWAVAATTNTSAVLGQTVAALPDRPATLYWRGDTLDIVILNDPSYTPPSVTEADLLNGSNRALVGSEGRWELIGWQTAQQVDSVTWRLTGLLRGLRGTEWATGLHLPDDWFLPVERLTRINSDAATLGAERLLRAVTFGLGLTEAADHAITLVGECLKPYAAAHPRGYRGSAGDLRILWMPRSRIGGDWLDETDVPLGETVSDWEVDILNSQGAVLRTLDETAVNSAALPHRVIYSAADQVTDFGSTQSSVTVRIYQRSALVGRGHYLEATL